MSAKPERKVDLVWSYPHYLSHSYPIWEKLPRELRGKVCQPYQPPDPGNWGMVASWQDLEPIRYDYQTIYVEHGAGQAYGGDEKTALQPGYSGSGGYRHVNTIGFIAPNDKVASRWTTAPSIAVGCPKLDRYMAKPGYDYRLEGTVCFAFHWDCTISPEARSTFTYYGPHLRDIVDRWVAAGWDVYGHAHPKWEGLIDDALRHCGMVVLKSDAEVFDKAGILIMDNSSLMYEFAAIGRPVVALNAPWYRRDIEHGLRFWEHVPGIQIDSPDELAAFDIDAFADRPDGLSLAWDAAEAVYKYRDGRSSQRAADWCVTLLS